MPISDVVPGWFKTTKAGQAILAETAATDRAERERLIREREAALKTCERESKPAWAAFEKAQAATAAARAALEEAQAAERRARQALESAGIRRDLVVTRTERALREGVAAHLDPLREEIGQLRQRVREGGTVGRMPFETDQFTGQVRGGGLDREALAQHLAALDAAARALDALALEADPEPTAALATIRSDLHRALGFGAVTG